MTGSNPVVQTALTTDGPTPASWEEACQRLEKAQTYWMATVRPDGRPHLRPVLAVWVDGALHTTSSRTARKSKNLGLDPSCVITANCADLDIVVEGTAARVTDEAQLQRVAEAYLAKYGWPVTIHDGGFDAPYAAPTAGAGPFDVYELTSTTVFGFQTAERFGSARWGF